MINMQTHLLLFVNRLSVMAVFLCVFVIMGCESNAPDQLHGTWRSAVAPSEWGEDAFTELTFAEGTTVTEKTTFLPSQRTLSVTNKYRISKGSLASVALNKGDPLRSQIENGVLVLTDGTVSFRYSKVQSP
jgi:hypothetical protein